MSESRSKRVVCPQCNHEGFVIVPPAELPEGVHHEPNALIVRCSLCEQRYRIRWEGQMRLNPAGSALPALASELYVGDVLRLAEDIGDVRAGLWAVVEVGTSVRLARCMENEDGVLAMTHHTATITLRALERFEPMHQRLEPPLNAEDTPWQGEEGSRDKPSL